MNRLVAETAGAERGRTELLSEQARYHNALRRKVLDAHPEAARLSGTEWRTAIAAILLFVIYWTTAWAVSRTNWWIVFLTALLFGQFLYHATASLVHESAHRLVFRNPRAKLAFDLVVEAVITSFGAQLVYQHNHTTSHHPHLGEYARDYEHEDAYRVAAREAYRQRHPLRFRAMSLGLLLVDLLPFGFVAGMLFFPRVLAHAARIPLNDTERSTGATRPPRGELRLFALFSLGVHVVAFLCLGFLGWLFHVWTMSLIFGRWGASIRGQILAEHYGEDDAYPTRSTYWWGNPLFFNIGYHSEHHTFPSVPWTRLPKLKAMAPEVFNVAHERGWFGFWWMQVKSDFTLPRRRSALEVSNRIRTHDEAPVAENEGATIAA